MGRSDCRPPPAFFSARLTGDALIFYRSLTTAQKSDYNELKRLFRQQYKPYADVLKAQVKSLCQLPGQDVSVFNRTLRDLAGKAHTDDAVRLPTITDEVRKAKPTVVEDALSLALEMQSYWNLHGQQPDTHAASGNKLTGPSPSHSELFSDLIFTIKEEVKQVVDEQSGPPQRDRSSEHPTSSRSQQLEWNNHTNQNQRRTWNQNHRNRTNSRSNTPKGGHSQDSKNRVSFNISGINSAKECQRCHRKNHETKVCKACFRCGRVGHFRRDCRSRSQPLN